MAEREPIVVDAPAPEPEAEPVPTTPRRRRNRVKGRPQSEAAQSARRANMAKAQAARSGRTMSPAALKRSVADTVRSTSGAMSIAGVMVDPRLLYDAEIIAGKADELAAELVALAEKSPPLYAALVSLVQASQWAKLGGLVVAIALPIAANHGLLPREAAALVDAPLPPERPVKVVADAPPEPS